jgi:hypothetical protein
MNIGDKVRTSCNYTQMLKTQQPFKGTIIKIDKERDDLVKVEKECGCSTWIDTAWLRKTGCSCHCSCSCHDHHCCCCSH